MTVMEMVFAGVNVGIAGAYALLAVFFGKRVILPRNSGRRGWRVLVALAFIAIFFIACSLTHMHMVMDTLQGGLDPHWYTPFSLAIHTAQLAGGFGFLILASRWVELKIFDKQHFEHLTNGVPDDRLDT